VVGEDDVLVLGRWELSAAVLRDIVAPGRRLLWEFVASEGGDELQPVAYSEDQVLWLNVGDVERTGEDVKDLCR
jgi:hypothetical protein